MDNLLATAVRGVLDRQVAEGRLPGYATALRSRGQVDVVVGGVLTLGRDEPVQPGTPFRLASVSKVFAAVLALSLVEDGTLALEDDVRRWLPELAEPRVLRDVLGPLDDTEPARRPVTVLDLLTCTAGVGGVWEECPVQTALDERGLSPGPFPPAMAPDEFVRRLAEVPLVAQPGSAWRYHTGSDLLGVLLARAADRSLSDLLRARVTGPLDLSSTGFWSEATALPTGYQAADGGLVVSDPPDGRFSAPPVFESLAAGLVSSAPDVLALLTALADGGGPLLRPETVARMTAESITPSQRAPSAEFLGEGLSWGLHVGVRPADGRWGWDGGSGTTAWADPGRDVVAVLLTQRGMAGPEDLPTEFWATVHESCPARPRA